MLILTSYSSGISLLPHFPRNCAAASRSSKLGHWLRRVFKPLKICIKKPQEMGTSEKTIIGMSTWFSHPPFSPSQITRVLRNCLWTVLNAEDLSCENFKCPKDQLGFFAVAKLVKSFLINRKAKTKESVWRAVITYLVKHFSFWHL